MKSFFKEILKRLALSLVSSVLFAIFSLFLLTAILTSLVDDGIIEHEPDSILTLNLTMNLTDRPGGMGIEDLTRQALTDEQEPPQMHLWEVLQALKKAKSDPKVKALFIEGGFMPSGYGCGYATVQELVDGILDFKKSSKPVIGYMRNPSQLDYLVFSICDELSMDPSGSLLFKGLSSESLFFGEAFEKYGVGIQVVRTGDFKGAVEPFISTEFSEENRQQINRLLRLRWKDYMATISNNRSVDAKILQQKFSENYLLKPTDALAEKLVDSVVPYDQIVDRLIEVGSFDDEYSYTEIDFIKYLDRPDTTASLSQDLENPSPQVKIVYVEGSIMDGWGDDGTSVGGHQIAKRLQEARADENCRAIVLRVNSPGGSVSGSDAILQELRRVRQDGIPVVVSMGPVAASGGYWIATECDRLLASKQTITGSIGVFGLLPNLKDIAAGYGMYWDAVKTHNHSDIMSVSRPKSPEELAVIQEYVQSLYAKFVQLVATARNMETDKVEMIAEGRVWTGIDAKTAGLIDAFGGIEASVQQAAQLAQLGHDYEVVEVPQVETPLQALEEMLSASAQASSRTDPQRPGALYKIKDELLHNLSFLQSLNDPRHAYGVLPWYRRAFGFVD